MREIFLISFVFFFLQSFMKLFSEISNKLNMQTKLIDKYSNKNKHFKHDKKKIGKMNEHNTMRR